MSVKSDLSGNVVVGTEENRMITLYGNISPIQIWIR